MAAGAARQVFIWKNDGYKLYVSIPVPVLWLSQRTGASMVRPLAVFYSVNQLEDAFLHSKNLFVFILIKTANSNCTDASIVKKIIY